MGPEGTGPLVKASDDAPAHTARFHNRTIQSDTMTSRMEAVGARRPLKSRETRWAARVAAWLAARRVRPNSISVASAVFAAIGAIALLASRDALGSARIALLIGAAVAVQCRLLCNLFDGMVAVEGGFRTKSGEIFNDFPDRVADPLLLVALGYATPFAWSKELGWCAALLAVMTAYVRVLGGAAGAKHDFGGPMAKPQRMALLTMASLLEVGLQFTNYRYHALFAAAALIAGGSLITVILRLRRIVRELEAR